MSEENKLVETEEEQDVLPRTKAILEIVRLSEEEQKQSDNQQKNIDKLLANTQEISTEQSAAEGTPTEEQKESKESLFQKYKIKDIVFLAIITACTLVTGAVMPLLVNVPLFGIIQLGLGLQFSLFPVIGMMKVRKPGALLFQSIFISIFLVFMFPPMAMLILCALLAEVVALLIFRGYKNDWSCVLAGTLYMPMTIPFLFLYYNAFYNVSGEEKAAVSMFLGGSNPWVIVGITAAVVAVCFVGSLVGMLIARELKKAGKFKQ